MPDAKYNTKQRDIILNFLVERNDRHMTAEDIYEQLRSAGQPVGKSTVYRHLETLVSSGDVRKYSADGMSACYQFADSHCAEHYHLRCSKCGRLIHTDCAEFAAMISHFAEKHNFTVDMTKTVLYGICGDCKNKENNL